jgi:hypothetical protein
VMTLREADSSELVNVEGGVRATVNADGTITDCTGNTYPGFGLPRLLTA